MIVLIAGLPGTGKTTLARELARQVNGRVLSKDDFRHAIFLPEEIEYSSRQDDFCLQLMIEVSGYLLSRDPATLTGNEMAQQSEPFPAESRPIFWTDDYCDLLHLIRWQD